VVVTVAGIAFGLGAGRDKLVQVKSEHV
jgi:CP family cyanate transporter-like MFS transporter